MDPLLLAPVLHGAGIAAVEWFERLLPAAGGESRPVILRGGAGDSRSIRLEACGAALGT